MATLYEYYNTGDDSYYHIYSIFWSAQTFTPSTAHKITSVKLKLYRSGLPGTLTIGIRATDVGGHPTGADLCSGTIDGNTLTEAEAGAWYEITFATGCVLSPDTKYAIVLRAPDGNSTNRATWKLDYANATYDGGNREYSGDSGSSWDSSAGDDFMFEEWGEPVSQVTYHFNAYTTPVWTDPDNIVDGDIGTFGYTNAKKTAQTLTGNSCPATDLGTIAKVELRLYGYGDGDDRIDITPVFTGGNGDTHQTTPVVSPGSWGTYQDITSDTNAEDWAEWSDVQNLDCIIDSVPIAKGNTLYCAKVEIRVTYTPADGNVTVTPGVIAQTLTEYVPILKEKLTPSTLALSTTGYASILKEVLTPVTVGLTTTSYASILKEVTTPSTLAQTITGYASVLGTGVIPTTLSLSDTEYAPVLKFGVIPQTLALVCSFFAPTVTATGVALYSGMMKLRDSFKIVQRRRTVL